MDDYQDNRLSFGFPVKLSALDKAMEKAKEDQNANGMMGGGVMVEYAVSGRGGIRGMEDQPNTDEDNRKVMDLISSVNQTIRFDQNMANIVREESEFYFSGQKSAAEVADIIQGRVSNYINESR